MSDVNPVHLTLGALRDFYIEFFGVLVPGAFFLVLTSVGFLMPTLAAIGVMGALSFWPAALAYSSSHAFGAFSLAFLFSYVAGNVFYRQDPKVPDQRSIRRMRARDKQAFDSGCVRLAVQGADEYPYASLKNYLEQRGFGDLASYVMWSGADFLQPQDRSNADFRSKHFINSLKHRVRHMHPEAHFELIRNEAQVRMMSSLWYAAGSVARLTLIGGLAVIVIAASAAASDQNPLSARVVELGFWVGLVLLTALRIRFSIEKFIHYQRVREIVQVLVAWHLTIARRPAFAVSSGD